MIVTLQALSPTKAQRSDRSDQEGVSAPAAHAPCYDFAVRGGFRTINFGKSS